MLISGRCHCGNIAFTLRWQPEPQRIPARACSCTFCSKHGGVWTSCPAGALQVRVADPARVNRYRFGTETAEFHICAICGVVPVVTSEVGGRVRAVVNVNAFEQVDAALIDRSGVSFEGEATADRLARRERNWIPEVEFTSA